MPCDVASFLEIFQVDYRMLCFPICKLMEYIRHFAQVYGMFLSLSLWSLNSFKPIFFQQQIFRCYQPFYGICLPCYYCVIDSYFFKKFYQKAYLIKSWLRFQINLGSHAKIYLWKTMVHHLVMSTYNWNHLPHKNQFYEYCLCIY